MDCGTYNTVSCSCTYSTLPVLVYDATVVDVKVNDDFQFKPFLAGSGVDITETNGVIIISNDFQVNNTVFVDQQFGSDITGARESPTVAFQTLSAALDIAIPGDTIYVRPGTYITPTLVLKNGVNFYLELGTIVTSSDLIFQAAGVSLSISGFGNFESSTGIAEFRQNTQMIFQANSITCGGSNAFGCLDTSSVIFDIKNNTCNNQCRLIYNTATVDYRADKITINTGEVFTNLGTLQIRVSTVTSQSITGLFNQDIGRSAINAEYVNHNGVGFIFGSTIGGKMLANIGHLIGNGLFASVYGTVEIQSNLIEHTLATVPANMLIYATGKLIINAAEFVYTTPTVSGLFSNNGELFITGNLYGTGTQTSFLSGSGTSTFNCPKLTISGSITSAVNITSDDLVFLDNTLTVNVDTFITAKKLTLFAPFVLNSGNLNLYVQFMNSIVTVLAVNGGTGHIQLEKVNSTTSIINILGNSTIEFGGVWTTSGNNLITNTAVNPVLTLLPSKLISANNFITSTNLINIYTMPSITKFGPSLVTAVPSAALFINASLL